MNTRATTQATDKDPSDTGVEVIVDLGETDPNKAVERRRAAPADNGAVQVEADDGDERDSRQFNARLSRMRRGMQRQFDQKLAERDAAHQRELTELRERLDRVTTERRDGGTSADESAHKAKMDGLQRDLEAAIEKGDSAAQARITREMQAAEAAFWNKKTEAQLGTRDDKPAAGARASAPANGTRTAASAGPSAAGARFIRANEEWWDDPEYAVEKQAASIIFAQLRDEEGMDDKSDETFAEVARRLKAKFPKLKVGSGKRRDADDRDDEDDEGSDQLATRRAPTGAANDAGEGRRVSSRNRRTLTQQDIKTMRMVGMDPDNNAHVMQFLREGQALENA